MTIGSCCLDEFKHLVSGELKHKEDIFVSASIIGNYCGVMGTYLYGSIFRYDYPELLPKGLKQKLNRKAHKMINRAWKEYCNEKNNYS